MADLGWAVLGEALEAYCEAMPQRILAAYALGSLARGGFSLLVSDVDLALIISDPLRPADPELMQRVADRVRRGSSKLHQRLSTFWGTPSTLRGLRIGGRFPPLDRLDLLEHGRLLLGDDARRGLPRPSYAELVVAGANFALEYLARGDAVEEIRRPELLLRGDMVRLTKLVLMPVRLLFTAQTGRVGTNADSVAWYTDDKQPPSRELVAAALGWRTNPPDNADEALTLLQVAMVPLYRWFIGEYAARLEQLDRLDLAEEYARWQRGLEFDIPTGRCVRRR